MSYAIAHKAPRNAAHQAVSPKIAAAILLMLHEGERIDIAAQHVGLTTKAVRDALDLPHVQRFIRTQRQVRLASITVLNPTRLERIADAGNGNAAVMAIRMLEELGNPGGVVATNAQTLPGVTINIISNQPQADEDQHVQPMVIEHEPATDRGGLVDQPSSQAKKSSVKKAGGKNRSRPARS